MNSLKEIKSLEAAASPSKLSGWIRWALGLKTEVSIYSTTRSLDLMPLSLCYNKEPSSASWNLSGEAIRVVLIQFMNWFTPFGVWPRFYHWPWLLGGEEQFLSLKEHCGSQRLDWFWLPHSNIFPLYQMPDKLGFTLGTQSKHPLDLCRKLVGKKQP